MLLDLHHLVDQCLHNSDSHIIVVRLLFMVNRDQVEMYAYEDSFNFKLVDHFLQYFAQFQQTFYDKTWKFGLHGLILVPSE